MTRLPRARRRRTGDIRRLGPVGVLLTASALLIGACGASPSHQRAAVTSTSSMHPVRVAQPSLAPGKLLVLFKRVVGADPLASQLTVDKDGRAAAVITLGGIEGEHKQIFTIPPGQLQRLRRLIGGTRLRNTGCCDARFYIYWVSIGAHSWTLEQREVPRAIRPLMDDLDAITDRHTVFKGPAAA